MNRRSLVLWLLLLSVFFCGCSSNPAMTGRWKGEDAEGQEVVLFLDASGKFEAFSKGEKLAGTWSVDSEVQPNRIDLKLEGRTLSSIVKMQGDSLLIEAVGDDGKIPTKFTDKATFYKRQP